MDLPLVSVVITNFNYARFLERAVRSIEAQSYPRREIVIVDDASTDDSVAVIEGLIAAGVPIVLIRLTENVGQSQACRRGFAATRGEFVVFMDADDLLLPDFLKTHLFALMCCQFGVAFSSSSFVHVDRGQAIRWNCAAISRGAMAARRTDTSMIRDMSRYLPDALRCGHGVDDIHFCAAGSMQWYWSPTTSNCFRRDALTILFACPEIDLRIAFDVIVLPILGCLFGSVLIDIPLSQYVNHGANSTSNFADLDGAVSWNQQHSREARLRTVELIANNARRLVDELRVEPGRVVATAREALRQVRQDVSPEALAALAERIVEVYGGGGRSADAAAMRRALDESLTRPKREPRRRRSWLPSFAGLVSPQKKKKKQKRKAPDA